MDWSNAAVIAPVFVVVALFPLALIGWWRTKNGEVFSTMFARLYGLLVVAGLGVLLVSSDADNEARTGAFTLLGTVAGYLASDMRVSSTDSAKSERQISD